MSFSDQPRFGPLSESLGFLLRLAQLQAFEEYFNADGHAEHGPGEMSILLMIDANPSIRQGVLARALRIKRAHMTKIIQSFDRAGLVHTSVPEDDRRSLELMLTQAGKDRLTRIWDRVSQNELGRPATLTQRETETLKRLLRKYLSIATQAEG